MDMISFLLRPKTSKIKGYIDFLVRNLVKYNISMYIYTQITHAGTCLVYYSVLSYHHCSYRQIWTCKYIFRV